jgi:hypothetical protein
MDELGQSLEPRLPQQYQNPEVQSSPALLSLLIGLMQRGQQPRDPTQDQYLQTMNKPMRRIGALDQEPLLTMNNPMKRYGE